MEVTYDHVESEDADPPLNAPDVYMKMRLYPWTSSCRYSIRTDTQDGQDECNNVFRVPPLRTFYTFCNVHTTTRRSLDWAVYDYDKSNSDELMTRGSASLPLGISRQHSGSRDFWINFRTVNPSTNCYLLTRTFPSSVGLNQPITVVLSYEFNETPMTIYEEIPQGFTFDGSTIPPDAPPLLLGDGNDDNGAGTLVWWTFSSPQGVISYDLTTPSSNEMLRLPFGNKLQTGNDVYITALQLDELVIGGVLDDCDGDVVDDGYAIQVGLVPDCNQNGVPDACDIASGGSEDQEPDGIPDECQTPTGTSEFLVPAKPSIRGRPNPFNPGVTIDFVVPEAGFVKIEIFNAAGRHVNTLVEGEQPEGRHTIQWNGTSDDGHRLPTGVYYATYSVGGVKSEAKLVLIK